MSFAGGAGGSGPLSGGYAPVTYQVRCRGQLSGLGPGRGEGRARRPGRGLGKGGERAREGESRGGEAMARGRHTGHAAQGLGAPVCCGVGARGGGGGLCVLCGQTVLGVDWDQRHGRAVAGGWSVEGGVKEGCRKRGVRCAVSGTHGWNAPACEQLAQGACSGAGRARQPWAVDGAVPLLPRHGVYHMKLPRTWRMRPMVSLVIPHWVPPCSYLRWRHRPQHP